MEVVAGWVTFIIRYFLPRRQADPSISGTHLELLSARNLSTLVFELRHDAGLVYNSHKWITLSPYY